MLGHLRPPAGSEPHWQRMGYPRMTRCGGDLTCNAAQGAPRPNPCLTGSPLAFGRRPRATRLAPAGARERRVNDTYVDINGGSASCRPGDVRRFSEVFRRFSVVFGGFRWLSEVPGGPRRLPRGSRRSPETFVFSSIFRCPKSRVRPFTIAVHTAVRRARAVSTPALAPGTAGIVRP